MKNALIGLVLLALAGGAAYYFLVMQEGGADMSEASVRASFAKFSDALGKNNLKAAQTYVDPNLKDASISIADFQKVLAVKRTKYRATIKMVKVTGMQASVTYSRAEQREGGGPMVVEVSNEVWVQDKVNPGLWRLYKLAADDKWFRDSSIGPVEEVAEEEGAQEAVSVIQQLRTKMAEGPRVMQSGDRYSAFGKRDPFRPLIDPGDSGGSGLSGERCEPDRIPDILESYDLMSLKLSGIILQEGDDSVVLLEVPDGKGYTVRAGMYIGKNCGRITEITSDRVVVRELIHNPGSPVGVFEEKETDIKLRPEEG